MNELKQLPSFQKILDKYAISEKGKAILAETTLIVMSAPTSSGRNTIIRRLLETGRYHFIVSDTTRQPRMNNGEMEKDGREYWFKSEDEFLEGLREGKYLEAEILHNQQVSGISIRELEKANKEGKIAVSDTGVKGTDNIVRSKPDTIALFVLPPSFQEWQNRLKNRGIMTADELRRRMSSAVDELNMALKKEYYTFIVSIDIEESLKHINSVVEGRLDDLIDQKQAHQLATDLRDQTIDLLKSL